MTSAGQPRQLRRKPLIRWGRRAYACADAGDRKIAIETIAGIDDPRIADYRRIDEPALVRDRGLFIAEGRLVVERVIRSGRYTVRSVLVSPAAAQQLAAKLGRLLDVTPVYVCEAGDFRAITGYNIHRGCLAIVVRPAGVPAKSLISSSHLVVVVEAVANADNIGGIFRNAAAFGADAVLLDPASCDPLYRKAIRTSMAATLMVPFARLSPWTDALEEVRRSGFTVAGLTPRRDAEPLRQFAARARGTKVALLLGTEGAGLSDGALSKAHAHVRIDIGASIDSLNVAVAAGIALYELGRP